METDDFLWISSISIWIGWQLITLGCQPLIIFKKYFELHGIVIRKFIVIIILKGEWFFWSSLTVLGNAEMFVVAGDRFYPLEKLNEPQVSHCHANLTLLLVLRSERNEHSERKSSKKVRFESDYCHACFTISFLVLHPSISVFRLSCWLCPIVWGWHCGIVGFMIRFLV